MELHTIRMVLAMLEPHDFFFRRNRGYFQLGGDGIIDHQRVITHSFKGGWNSLENPLPIVSHFGGLSMHQALGTVDFAPKDSTETLMSETDAQHGDLAIKVLDGISRDTVIFDGLAWPRRDDEMTWVEGDQLIHRH